MSKIISVFGSKGGVGATFLATNIAIAFAKELNKGLSADRQNKSISIVELNIKRGGDLSLITGVSNAQNTKILFDILPLLDNLDPEMFKGFFSSNSSGVEVLGMPISYKEAQAVLDKLPHIINLLRSTYDYKIFC